MSDSGPQVEAGVKSRPKHIVLIGGGHSHVQVVRDLSRGLKKSDNVAITLVAEDPKAFYSGMLPGAIAGEYQEEEIEIDLVALCGWAGASWVQGSITGLDKVNRVVSVTQSNGGGVRGIAYDFLSFNIGSTTKGLELPGVSIGTVATRPLREFFQRVKTLDAGMTNEGKWKDNPPHVVVVGGGTAGLELAHSFKTRYASVNVRVTLLDHSKEFYGGFGKSTAKAVKKATKAKSIEIVPNAHAAAIDPETTQLTVVQAHPDLDPVTKAPIPEPSAKTIEADMVVWATGASPHPVAKTLGLPVDDAGYFRVRRSLQIVGEDRIFAVGDCAAHETAPWVPRAGVYAVRQGPVLTANLLASVRGTSLRHYLAQSGFLSLINMGDGTAITSYYGWTMHNRFSWWLKDRIDRSFMYSFKVGAGLKTPPTSLVPFPAGENPPPTPGPPERAPEA